MTRSFDQALRALAFGALIIAGAARAAAATPPPAPQLPKVPLHVEVTVEVNKYGQVVRVKSSKPSKNQGFDIETFGNALQMWIRKPDGTATVGLYRVTYDYDPKTQKVARHVAIISAGGNWGNEPGAANVMMENLRKQQEAAERKAQEQNEKLPSLNEIRGVKPSPSPSSLPPH